MLRFRVGDVKKIAELKKLIGKRKVIVYYEGIPLFGNPLAVLDVSEAVEVEGPRTYKVVVETIDTPFFLGPTDSIAVY